MPTASPSIPHPKGLQGSRAGTHTSPLRPEPRSFPTSFLLASWPHTPKLGLVENAFASAFPVAVTTKAPTNAPSKAGIR